ncbi:hypothetical protein DM860_015879 [Cuscuta australis]|uniref:AT-hook motif nuclear-localized protein n=1 Tax=Cuscuta australis TaxID=267555 RepID=A0A328DYF6_9ASTE|nr:hypothetical protein DM860_015879 [Cuscuta australis]
MDLREGMSLYGSASYYINPGGISVSGSSSGFKPILNPNVSAAENPSTSFDRRVDMGMTTHGGGGGDPVMTKKKRGRPRKYGPDGSNMSLALSSMSSGPSTNPGPKRNKGRPRGSGWKQQLAPLGEWMNRSAGVAFTPHVLHIQIGEDVAAKILAFSRQRPRALCILSANGTVSAITLRAPASSGATVTYEGRFQILRLSGSYLVAESGGSGHHNRIGGISISVCSPDGHVIGGAIGGQLIAASSVQVVLCSFVHGTPNEKHKTETSGGADMDNATRPAEKPSGPIVRPPDQDRIPSMAAAWQSNPSSLTRSYQTGIDLTRG